MINYKLFNLFLNLGKDKVRILVTCPGYDNRGASRYEAKVLLNGKVLFEKLWGAFSPLHAEDSKEAKAHVLSHLAMKPGDTDKEFFEDYTEDQLDFVNKYSDDIWFLSHKRYGEY